MKAPASFDKFGIIFGFGSINFRLNHCSSYFVPVGLRPNNHAQALVLNTAVRVLTLTFAKLSNWVPSEIMQGMQGGWLISLLAAEVR